MQAITSFKKTVRESNGNYSTDDEEYSEWMLSVKTTLGMLNSRPWDRSIYKVPSKLRRVKEDAYTPHIVSIGPLHQGKPELQAMEEHKWRYMLNFLWRAAPADKDSDDDSSANDDAEEANQPPLEMALEECGKAISNLEKKARACYAENINLNEKQLAERLLVDGCFMLELFIKHAERPHREMDPIFDSSWMFPALQHDLALLENQIPFVVLHKLFKAIEKTANKQFLYPLKQYVLLFFRSALSLSDTALNMSKARTATPKHLLDILHQAYKPTIPINYLEGQLEKHKWEFQRCATELFKSGIQFQVESNWDINLLDVTFRNGAIIIPPVVISNSSDSLFRNLIALEQFSFCRPHVTSYVLLMSSLIRSPKDAALIGSDILKVEYGGEDNVSTFFNNLRKEVVCKDFYYAELCDAVNEYRRFPLQWGSVKAYSKILSNEWTESLHDLRRTYFQNRWSIISFLAALFVIILTILQTVCAFLPYYPKH